MKKLNESEMSVSKLNSRAEKLIVNCIYHQLDAEYKGGADYDNIILYWSLQEKGFDSDKAADASIDYVNGEPIEEINKKYNIDCEEIIDSANVEAAFLKEAKRVKYEFYNFDSDNFDSEVVNFIVDSNLIEVDDDVIYKWSTISDCIDAVNSIIEAFRTKGLENFSVKDLYAIKDDFEEIYDMYTEDKDKFSEAVYTYVEQDKIFKLNEKAQEEYVRLMDPYDKEYYNEYKAYMWLICDGWDDYTEEVMMYTYVLFRYNFGWSCGGISDDEAELVSKYQNKKLSLKEAFDIVNDGYRLYTNYRD